ncbi:MAG: M20/M25/M40 family metallo-hydrolase [Polyangiaceae bacterium]|nr:M20/M25/M40 family metallo-hydrolase [Polyangiaceae bacterium]MBK9001838.1 M20/M25/M40 family metallo-hydrolase [Myxococcales bacterium]MCE7894450.1 M20/M25/M40 family metallo-hydrolase [Sorangiineae bacterium PRO1]MCL4753574.1 M20/M25/M40 family metallo-hydrolase [Myxococcales bacterium]
MSAIDHEKVAGEALELFKALLRIDTTNPPGNERPAADLLARLFEREGIEFSVLESEPTRASIVARLRGSGEAGPLLLNGHLDVVPADPEHWSHPPFEAVEADGCVWGRGAIDMKNMVAMSAMTLVALKRSGAPLRRDVIFAGVADEEAGSNKGALFLVQQHPELVRAEFVLNEVGGHTLHMGSSRFYPVQVSEKGICWFELVASGDPGHGSMPHPNNAVVKLSRAIAALGTTRLPQRVTPVVETFLRTLARGAPFPQKKLLPLMLEPRLAGFLLDTLERQNPDQARGINAMLRNTVSPTILRAGRKVNVIPSEARAELDGRVVPGTSVGEFLAEVQEVIGRDLRLNVLEQHDGTVFETHTPLYDAIVKAVGRHDPGGTVVPYMIPGFTDSFAYARLGATCYGFSPVRLPPDLNFTRMYHGHDERIPVDGFTWGFGVLSELVRDFCLEEG